MLVLHFCFYVTALQMTKNEHCTVCRQLSDSETHRHWWYFAEIWRLFWFGHRLTGIIYTAVDTGRSRSRRSFRTFELIFVKCPCNAVSIWSVTIIIFSLVLYEMIGLYLVPIQIKNGANENARPDITRPSILWKLTSRDLFHCASRSSIGLQVYICCREYYMSCASVVCV